MPLHFFNTPKNNKVTARISRMPCISKTRGNRPELISQLSRRWKSNSKWTSVFFYRLYTPEVPLNLTHSVHLYRPSCAVSNEYYLSNSYLSLKFYKKTVNVPLRLSSCAHFFLTYISNRLTQRAPLNPLIKYEWDGLSTNIYLV